ncbi:MAG: hypothetical protein L0Y76_02450, partial [Ignavibacteria bacterium]|nr:hypothetical protein [Ignavibacteria bacterium]
MESSSFSRGWISKITSANHSPFFRATAYLLIFSIILLNFACVTSNQAIILPRDYDKDSDYKLKAAILTDGRRIPLDGSDYRFFENYKDMKNVIVYEPVTDTVRIDDKSYKIRKSVKEIIEIKNVQEFIVEKTESHSGTVIAIVAAAAALAVVITII